MLTTQTMTAAPASGLRVRIGAITGRLGRFPLAILQLGFRLAVASVFLKAGLGKLASWEITVQLFRDEYKVPAFPPEIAAAMATTFELGCSTLLIAGLATRLATLPLLGMISARTGRSLNWDGDKEQIIGDPEANKLLSRPYRAPWVYPV